MSFEARLLSDWWWKPVFGHLNVQGLGEYLENLGLSNRVGIMKNKGSMTCDRKMKDIFILQDMEN